jgi:hypothetical protein
MADAAQSAAAMVDAQRPGILILLGPTHAWTTSGLFAHAKTDDTHSLIGRAMVMAASVSQIL